MIFRSFLIFIILLATGSALAQESSVPQILKSGIELGSGFSFTGINTNLAYTLTWKENLVFVGPKLALSDSYLFAKGPWGIQIGYRRLLPGLGKFRTFATVEYQVVFMEPYNPNSVNIKGLNRINEYHLSYGLQYQWTARMLVGNTLGAGWYTESLLDLDNGNRNAFHGFSPQIRLFIHYSISGRE